MKTLVILILLLIPCVVMAETFTMPLSTVDTNPATAATLLGRPEITEYADRVQRIGNVFIIEWNQYDTEAVSVEYKALKPLGVNPPKSFAVDGSDEPFIKTASDEEETNDRRIAGVIHNIYNGESPKEEIATVVEEIINGGMTGLGNIPQGTLTEFALNYDYGLGKQLIVYIHENYKYGSFNVMDELVNYSQKNDAKEDAISFIKSLQSLKSGVTNKRDQEDLEKTLEKSIKMMQPPD